jgi:hypothetical protein
MPVRGRIAYEEKTATITEPWSVTDPIIQKHDTNTSYLLDHRTST